MRKLKALLLCILAAVTVASTVCAFAAETEPAPLQVVSVSPIVYSDNTDGTPQGESGHTAEIGIRFNRSLGDKMYNYVNARLKALGAGFLTPVGAASVEETAELQDKLGDFVNDYIKLNGKTLRNAFAEMSATVTDLPEPYFAVHMDEDRQGIRLYLDNRIAYNADYLKQTIVTEAGSATVRTAADGNVLTVRAGFRSGYTNAAVTKDVSFAYDAEVKEWKSVATPVYATVDNQHAVNGLKSLLAVDFDTELTTQTGLNHDLPFLNQFIFIDGLPMNEYGAAKGTDIRVNQIAPHSFNLWQFDAGTPNAKDFPASTRILFRKGLQFVGEDGVNPVPDLTLAENTMFVLGDVWSQEIVADGLSVVGFGALTEEENAFSFEINFSADITDSKINVAEDLDWVKEGVKINSKTIAEWNAEQKLVTIVAEKSALYITADRSVWSLDNADFVEVCDAFVSGVGIEIVSGYSKFYNQTIGEWLDEAVTAELNGETVKIETISAFTVQSGNPCFTVTFDKPISYKYLPHYNGDISWHQAGGTAALGVNDLDILKMKVQPAHEGLLKGVSINGKTIEQIMAGASEGQDRNVVVMVHYNQDLTSMMFSWQAAYSDQVIDYTQDVVLTIDRSIFVTPNGGRLAEDVKLTYKNEFTGWYADGEIPEWKNTRVEKLDYLLYMENVDSYAIQVHFKAPASNTEMQNVQDMDFIRNGFKLNGFTIGEIMAGAKDADGNAVADPVTAHLLPPTGVPGTGKIVIHFFISAKITEATGGIKDKGNTLEIVGGTKLPSVTKVSRDYKFVYENGGWAEEVDTSGIEWEELHLVSVSKPVLSSDENVMFTLAFDKNITYKELLHINGDVSWLLAVSEQDSAPFRYTAEELNVLSAYGILSSLKEKILFNGQSIAELMEKEQNAAYRPVTVMVHVGQSGEMNTINIAFAGKSFDAEGNSVDGANKIGDLNAEFTFTVKAGFRTTLLGEVAKDETFRYNPAAGVFVKEAEDGALSGDTTINGVYYNGYKIEKNGTLVLKDTEKLDAKLFTVLLGDPTSVFEVVGGDALKEGDNAVVIRVTSTDGTVGEFAFTVTVQAAEKGSCGSTLGGASLIGACALLIAASLLLRKKQRKGGMVK